MQGACTLGDSTYSCCKKSYPGSIACDGLEGTERGTFSPAAKASVAVATGAAIGGATGVLIRGEREQLDELQKELDRVMEECAEHAEGVVNRRRLDGRLLDARECNEVVGTNSRGEPVTRAMALGTEKHTEAFQCLKEKLGSRIPGHFAFEQRYRFDPKTERLEPITEAEADQLLRTGQKHLLVGTLVPDVIIYAENLTQVRFVYDFKFVCVKGRRPTWRIYNSGPNQDDTQGDVYRKTFKVSPGRVAPGGKVIR